MTSIPTHDTITKKTYLYVERGSSMTYAVLLLTLFLFSGCQSNKPMASVRVESSGFSFKNENIVEVGFKNRTDIPYTINKKDLYIIQPHIQTQGSYKQKKTHNNDLRSPYAKKSILQWNYKDNSSRWEGKAVKAYDVSKHLLNGEDPWREKVKSTTSHKK